MPEIIGEYRQDLIGMRDQVVFEFLKNLSPERQIAIVRPFNPPPGIGGYVFDVVGDDTVALNSEITDHFLEDNSAIQDQIARKPEQVTVRGFVGELADVRNRSEAVDDFLSPRAVETNQNLPLNSPLVPELAEQAAATREEVDRAYAENLRAVQSANSLYGYYKGLTGGDALRIFFSNNENARNGFPLSALSAPLRRNKQQDAFRFFYALWRANVLFSVETPFGTWTNMGILTLRAIQPEASRFESEFQMTFKKIRTVSELQIQSGQLAGRAAYQMADTTQNGVAGAREQTDAQAQSLLYRLAQEAAKP